jgi:hypothetical protein
MRPAMRCGASLLFHRSNRGSSVDSGAWLPVALSDKIGADASLRYAFGATGFPSEDQAMTVRHSASAAERLCL